MHKSCELLLNSPDFPMNDFTVAYSAESDEVTLTGTDGVAVVYVNQKTVGTPVLAPEVEEVDVVLTDGTTKKFTATAPTA